MLTDQQEKILNTAEKLKLTTSTEGWENIVAYVVVRVKGLKNELARMDLSKDITKAVRKQGIIEGLNSLINRVSNVLQEAEKIKKESKEKK